jgi:hypothetical protein
MKLSEYTKNDKLVCNSDLQVTSWNRIFESKGDEINKTISNGFTDFKIATVHHMIPADKMPQRAKDMNIKEYVRTEHGVKYFSIECSRKLTVNEKREWGTLAISMNQAIQLPLDLWFTVHRCDIQERPTPEIITLNGKKYILM